MNHDHSTAMMCYKFACRFIVPRSEGYTIVDFNLKNGTSRYKIQINQSQTRIFLWNLFWIIFMWRFLSRLTKHVSNTIHRFSMIDNCLFTGFPFISFVRSFVCSFRLITKRTDKKITTVSYNCMIAHKIDFPLSDISSIHQMHLALLNMLTI